MRKITSYWQVRDGVIGTCHRSRDGAEVGWQPALIRWGSTHVTITPVGSVAGLMRPLRPIMYATDARLGRGRAYAADVLGITITGVPVSRSGVVLDITDAAQNRDTARRESWLFDELFCVPTMLRLGQWTHRRRGRFLFGAPTRSSEAFRSAIAATRSALAELPIPEGYDNPIAGCARDYRDYRKLESGLRAALLRQIEIARLKGRALRKYAQGSRDNAREHDVTDVSVSDIEALECLAQDGRDMKLLEEYKQVSSAACSARCDQNQDADKMALILKLAAKAADPDTRRYLWSIVESTDHRRILERMTYRDRGRAFSSRPMRGVERISEEIRKELRKEMEWGTPPSDWVPPLWALENILFPERGREPALVSALALIREKILEDKIERARARAIISAPVAS